MMIKEPKPVLPSDELEQQILLQGLKAQQKSMNPKYFYDKKGSELFEAITELEEYYLTRTETRILKKYAKEMATYIGENVVLIEPGAGNCQKVQLILDAINPKAYIPQDVSKHFLHAAAQKLKQNFEWLQVSPVVSDFSKPIAIPEEYAGDCKYVFYPGSTIGNFEPQDAIEFLKNMRKLVGPKGGLLIGMDLHKDSSLLEAAYDDTKGITADFNLNMLTNLNSKFGTDFDIRKFSHRAFYNEELQRIEMHLVSKQAQSYEVFGEQIRFTTGETIHTENSYKFSQQQIASMAQASGFKLIKTWLDEQKLFSINCFQSV